MNDIEDFKNITKTLREASDYEKMLKKMTKEQLVDILVIKLLADNAPFEPAGERMSLWYFKDPETGAKYLSNERPKKYVNEASGQPFLLSEGEVNIRIPKIMESMFPELEYADVPLKIDLAVSF